MSSSSKPTTRNGLRTICSLRLADAGVAAPRANPGHGAADADHPTDAETLTSVLQTGDIILCRCSTSWLSRAIADLDGYWCHAAIYVGYGQIVDAYSGGIGQLSVADILLAYPEGVAVARPEKDESTRAAAAAWARKLANPDPSRPAADPAYSGRDLGLGFALLLQARRTEVDRLPALESRASFGVLDSDDAETPKPFESTCSGLVYRAYAEGANSPLTISTAPGISLGPDERLRVRDGDDLWSFLNDEARIDPAAQPAGPGLSKLMPWVYRARMLADAMTAWVGTWGNLDDGIPIEQGVTPSDLWCSPDVGERFFLTEAQRQVAVDASQGCSDATE